MLTVRIIITSPQGATARFEYEIDRISFKWKEADINGIEHPQTWHLEGEMDEFKYTS